MLVCCKRAIHTRNVFEFIHCWPEAPASVDYLRLPHRHQFYVYCSIEVEHDNRELEFITVQHSIDAFLNRAQFAQRSSCEDIAHEVAQWLVELYGERDIAVSVLEDDENGATVYYNKVKEN